MKYGVLVFAEKQKAFVCGGLIFLHLSETPDYLAMFWLSSFQLNKVYANLCLQRAVEEQGK